MRTGMSHKPHKEAEVKSHAPEPSAAVDETVAAVAESESLATAPDSAPSAHDNGPEPAPISPAEFDQLKSAYEQLKAERDQLVDRVARLQAEFENARKRAERERQDFKDYATGNVVERFLPVLDNFELALKATGSADQLRSGIELIVKQMEDVLRQLQVLPVPAVGEQFDPRHHEALGTVERDDLPDQHVAEEIRRGYKLRERLLRPAMVRVASNPKQTSE
jgi:molecular chaperone GrpE